jgi:hypothetical protein
MFVDVAGGFFDGFAELFDGVDAEGGVLPADAVVEALVDEELAPGLAP